EFACDQAEGVRPLHRVHELADTGHVRDPRVTERRQVLHSFDDDPLLIVPNRWNRMVFERTADDHGGEPEACRLVDAGVVDPEVDHQDSVDPALAPPPPVDGDLVLHVAYELD